jgi:transposase InsO family protein
VKALDIEEILTAPRSPWQNPFVERVIGSMRRECLDHMIIFGEAHLRRVLAEYFDYYHRSRTHLSLAKNAPEHREVEACDLGRIRAVAMIGGLHHRSTRKAA